MHIIHPSEIRSLRSELMSSTALTPTQHKGGGFKMVLALVVAVAIPFAAGPIAGAIGLSGALGSAVAGGAIVGGVMGGAAAYAMDTNPFIGVLGGAIGGGISGANMPGMGPSDMGFGGGFAGPVSPTGVESLSPGYSAMSATGGGGPGLISGMPTVDASSFTSAFTPAGTDMPLLAGAPGASGADVGGQLTGWEGSADSGYGVYADMPPPDMVAATQAPVTGPAAAAGAGPEVSKTFGDRVGDFFGGDMTKFAGVQAGSKVLGSLMAGEPEQTELEKEQLAALQRARTEQGALQADKTKKAGEFYRQAQNVNPDFYGRMAMADELNRKKRAEMAGMRGISPRDTGARAAAQRRGALDTARLGSFDKARADAEAKRMGLMQSAISAAPTGEKYAAGRAADLKASDAPYRRMQEDRKDWQQIAGNTMAGGLELSDAEIKRRQRLDRIT